MVVAGAAAAFWQCALFPSLEGLSGGADASSGGSDGAPVDAARAPTFHGASANPGGTLTELELARPDGTAAGDLLVASVVYRGSMEIAAPAGWTILLDTPRDGGHLTSFVRTSVPEEPASHVFTVPVSFGLAGGVTAWGDATAIEASARATGDGETVMLPAVVGVGRTLLAVYAHVGAVTYLPPPGLTEHFDVRTPSGTYVASVSQASARQADADAQGPLAATASGRGGGWMAQTLLLR